MANASPRTTMPGAQSPPPKSRMPQVLAILGGVVAGIAAMVVLSMASSFPGQAAIKDFVGLQIDGVEVDFRPAFSPNQIHEIVTDTDDDGKPDIWEVEIRLGQYYQAVYHLQDGDGDGNADAVAFMGGALLNTFCRQVDQDGDGIYDVRLVVLGDRTCPDQAYSYGDHNMDGKLDSMRVHGPRPNVVLKAAYVLIDNRWVPCVKAPQTNGMTPEPADPFNPSCSVWVEMRDGEVAHVVFEDGEWRITE